MKIFRLTLCCLMLVGVLSSCRNDGSVSNPEEAVTQSEGLEYAPQMYHSIPYEPYTQLEYNKYNEEGLNAKHPPEHTVAVGYLHGGWPYGKAPLEDPLVWQEMYDRAAEELRLPQGLDIAPTEENLAHAQMLYETYCDHCHGNKGMGDGPISKEEKIIVPSYMSPAIMALDYGKMFYSITYGKNAMGPHGSMLSAEERWLLVRYVRKLQGRAPEGSGADTDDEAPAQPADEEAEEGNQNQDEENTEMAAANE